MTETYGILAHPAKHSLSPAMHNAAFKALKINADFKYFDIKPEDLKKFILKVRKEKIKGLSVSSPHKESIIKYLDKINKTAKKINAVNAVKNDRGKLMGTNFDWIGVQNSLLEKTAIKGKIVVVLGAGGAASAAVFAAKKNRAKKIHILNRTVLHARKLAKKYNCKYGGFDDFKDINPDIVIQATSAGMNNLKGVELIPKKYLTKRMVVMEMIYSPLITKIIKDAKAAGAKTITGEKMLLNQGFAAFIYWTKKRHPAKVMERAVYQNLK
ncbi:shikimate dehydrogenase [Candidatus Peregrinibacteria bacterium]|nr:shikimate dehydrogenase [Candidatus Peregrinibacteria bacterium]